MEATAEPSKRLKQACLNCRRKKARCPGERPICSFCSRLGQQCDYSESPVPQRDQTLSKTKDAPAKSKTKRNTMPTEQRSRPLAPNPGRNSRDFGDVTSSDVMTPSPLTTQFAMDGWDSNTVTSSAYSEWSPLGNWSSGSPVNRQMSGDQQTHGAVGTGLEVSSDVHFSLDDYYYFLESQDLSSTGRGYPTDPLAGGSSNSAQLGVVNSSSIEWPNLFTDHDPDLLRGAVRGAGPRNARDPKPP